jgi:hypothetical protein
MEGIQTIWQEREKCKKLNIETINFKQIKHHTFFYDVTPCSLVGYCSLMLKIVSTSFLSCYILSVICIQRMKGEEDSRIEKTEKERQSEGRHDRKC